MFWTQPDIRFRLFVRTALVVGGGVYRHDGTMGEDTAEEGYRCPV